MKKRKQELLAIIADPSRDVDARYAAGDALAELGDPRGNPFVSIPAGELQHKASRDSDVEVVDVPAFEIQTHLVTVAEFTTFIDAGGYDDPSLWQPDGWEWRLDHDVEAPRFWDEWDEWGAYLVSNHPVVGVSFYEADAYASFRELRLPTEREWERACRGDDARDFPWGDEWREDACPHRGHGPRATSPVGIYPGGVSPFGVHDLVGSVWQWTSDAVGGSYAVRGGAWNNLPWSIGAAGRNGYPPDARFSNLGFRCAR